MEIDYKRGSLNLEHLKKKQIALIEQFMLEFPEEKIVVFDKQASIIFNDVIDPSEFKKYNIQAMFYTNDFPKYQKKSYIYFVLPTAESISFMNKNRFFLTSGDNKHTVCFIGRRDAKVETNLHHNYIWDFLRVRELDITMVVAEYDCINMNISKSIHKLFVDNDIRTIQYILQSIECIQHLYGEIPEIISYGKLSNRLKDILIVENKINSYSTKITDYNANLDYGELPLGAASPQIPHTPSPQIPRTPSPRTLSPKPSSSQTPSRPISSSRAPSPRINPAEIKSHGQILPESNKNIFISKLIIIDRLIDTITPCLTQLTYEGTIDDIIGITNRQIYIGNRYIPLNSGCPYYQDARDKSLNVSNILLESHGNSCCLNLKYYGTDYDEDTLIFLSDVAKKNMEINKYLQAHVELRSILGKTISDSFWTKLIEIEHLILTVQEPESLLNSILDERAENAEFNIIDFIDRSITEQKPLYDVIGCLSIYLQIYGKNMSAKGYSTLVATIANKYEHSYEIINRMEKLGLMTEKKISIDNDTTSNSFRKISKKLNLLKKVNISNPNENDLCTICAGYAPIIGKIIETEKKSSKNPDDVVMVLFLGGCNYSEISCCRLLGNILIMTTEIFNKKQFFDSL